MSSVYGLALVLRPRTDLVRSVRAIAWELRAAWARGLRVSLAISGDERRVEGHVGTVSPSDAFAVVGDLHVPLERVLAVYRPSRLGDTTYREGEEWKGRIPQGARRDPRQLSIPGIDLAEPRPGGRMIP